MNLEDFMGLVRDMNEKCEDTLDEANKEYARDDDKFNNFEVTASIMRQINPRTPDIAAEDIAFIFMMKHMFSIVKGVSIREDMEGRFKDCINYLHLIHGIHKDKEASHAKLQETLTELRTGYIHGARTQTAAPGDRVEAP